MLGFIGLRVLGHNIPFLSEIFLFFYLTFVPGFIILRILKIHRQGIVNTLLFSIGLSLSFIMFFGFLINLILPVIGNSKPISLLPITIGLFVMINFLLILAYIRDKVYDDVLYDNNLSIEKNRTVSSCPLFLIILPIISILGTYFINVYNKNIILLFLIFLIAILFFLSNRKNILNVKYYPVLLYMTSLSLLWHNSLITFDLVGYDIHLEYYLQNLVIRNSLWDYTIPSTCNSMLSITMLAPIYNVILGIDTIWIFKVIYPILYSFVPLGIYQLYRKVFSTNVAFWGTFFFISLFVFYGEMVQLARQQIAEIFLALSLLLIFTSKLNNIQKSTLSIIFAFSLVVSHYGLSYLYILILLLSTAFLYLIKFIFKRIQSTIVIKNFNINYIILFIVFCLCWYMYLGSSSIFNTIIYIGNHVYNSLYKEFFLLEGRDRETLMALGLAKPLNYSLLRQLYLYIQYLTQLFIITGYFTIFIKFLKKKFSPIYLAISFSAFILIFLSIVLPYFSDALNMTRIYHITLFLLAPCCVIGGKVLFINMFKFLRLKREIAKLYCYNLMSFIFVLYFLFNTGFVFEVFKDIPTSYSLSYGKFDEPMFSIPEDYGRNWLINNTQGDLKDIYCDSHAGLLLRENINPDNVHVLKADLKNVPKYSLIFIRKWNIEKKEILVTRKKGAIDLFEYIKTEGNKNYLEMLKGRARIYDNKSSIIYSNKI